MDVRRAVAWWDRSEVAGRLAFGTAVAAAGVFRLWQATITPTGVWQDSLAYQAVAAEPFWSTSFWLGDRPPGLPLLWKLTGSPGGFARVQALVAAAIWAWLAWAIGHRMTRRSVGTGATLVVLAFSVSGPVLLWDRSVLTESLSLAAVAGLFAVVLEASGHVSLRWLMRFSVVVVLMVSLRDSQVLVSLAVGAAAAVYAWFGATDRGGDRRRFAALAAVVAVSIGAVGGQAASDSGRLTRNVADVYAVRVFPFPSRVSWFAGHGMPQADRINARARAAAAEPGGAKRVPVSPFDPRLAGLFDWLIHDGSSTYRLWLATHPGYVVTEPFVRPERSTNTADGAVSGYAGEPRVDLHLGWLFWPAWPIAAVEGLVVLSVVVWRRAWRSRLVWALGGMVVLGLLSMLAAWHGDGQEPARHTFEGQTMARLGVILALLVSLGRRGPSDELVGGRPAAGDEIPEALVEHQDGDHVGAVAGVELGHDATQVGLGRVGRDEGLGRDLLVAAPSGAPDHDAELGGGEPVETAVVDDLGAVGEQRRTIHAGPRGFQLSARHGLERRRNCTGR